MHARRRPYPQARRRIVAALRRWFEAEDFVEVEAGSLQVSPGNETHLHAFATELVRPGLAPRKLYLHTSPEFSMKKLLAAGEKRIFEFARVFRNRERSALHHPEFTMLEWYRSGEPYEQHHAGLRVDPANCGRGGRCEDVPLSRARGGRFRRAGASYRGRRLRAPCRHRAD